MGTASAPRTVTIKASDSSDVQIIGVDTETSDYQVQENGCPNLLAKNAPCTIKVIFTPFHPEKPGSRLNIKYRKATDPPGPDATFPVILQGKAIHWHFPFTRAVAGTDVSAASSKQ